MEEYVGLDVSLKETSVCVMDGSGRIVWQGKAASDPAALRRVLARRSPGAVRIGLETGPLTTWLWHELRAAELPVVCVDARHAQAALSMRVNKTDRNDAEGLAQLMRMGWYREVQVKRLSAHSDGALLAGRSLLVKQRCELENQIRGLLRNFGITVKATKGRAFGQSVADAAVKEAALNDIVRPLLAAWTALRLAIAVLTRRAQDRAREDATCQRLMTMPGVGPLVALAFRAAIDEPERFRQSRSVGAYLGLTPRRYASGETDRMGRISRCGDVLARTYLYEAANVHLGRWGKPNPLKTWGNRLVNRVGAKKARVALARRMAVVLHRMWRDGTDFGQPKAAA